MTTETPTVGTATPGADTPGARPFVWAIWAVMTALALRFVALYGVDVPFWDGWSYVGYWTGQIPLSLEFLWAFHNEHRIPLPKLLLVGLAHLTHCDFRSGMVFSVVALSALSAALIRAVRRLRGGATFYTDAFFPLLLLHWGHYQTFWSGFQTVFTLSTFFSIVMLLLIVRRPSRLGPVTASLASLCLLCLPLNGAAGVAMVPAMGLWLSGTAIVQWRRSSSGPNRRIDAAVAAGCLASTLAACAILVLYFRGYKRPEFHPEGDLLATVRTSIEFLGTAFGNAAKVHWPISGILTVTILVATVAVLLWSYRWQGSDRGRVVGLLIYLGGCGSLALGLGHGRSGFGPLAGCEPRYAVLAVPAFCAAYLAWTRFGPASLSRLGQTSLFTLACMVLLPNAEQATTNAVLNRAIVDDFERDLRDGMPMTDLVDNYHDKHPLLPHQLEVCYEALSRLRDARVGMFKRLRGGPDGPGTPLPLVRAETHAMTWTNDVGRPIGPDPYAVFALDRPRRVAEIRLRLTVESTQHRTPLMIYWRHSGRDDFDNARSLSLPEVTGNEHRWVTIPVHDDLDQLRIDLEGPSAAVWITDLAVVDDPIALAPAGTAAE